MELVEFLRVLSSVICVVGGFSFGNGLTKSINGEPSRLGYKESVKRCFACIFFCDRMFLRNPYQTCRTV